MQYECVAQLCDSLQQHIHDEVIRIEKTVNIGARYDSEIFDPPVILGAHMEKGELHKLRGRRGVYIFILDEAIELSSEQVNIWNQVGGASFKTSCAIDIIEGECLYLGSCVSKSLYSRIGEHYKKNGEFTALKLHHPSREILLESVHVTAFPIMKKYSDKQRRMLIPLIEKELHNVFIPLAGSSRV